MGKYRKLMALCVAVTIWGSLSVADAAEEILISSPDEAGAIISTAIKSSPREAGYIVISALRQRTDMSVVVSEAIKAAPDKTGDIVAAAMTVLPQYEDEITQAAISAGAARHEVMTAVAASKAAPSLAAVSISSVDMESGRALPALGTKATQAATSRIGVKNTTAASEAFQSSLALESGEEHYHLLENGTYYHYLGDGTGHHDDVSPHNHP